MTDPITSTELAAAAGITYRRLDYYIRNGLITTHNPAPGHGYTRTHPDTEIEVVARVGRLLDSGFGDITAAFRVARELDNGPVALTNGFVIVDSTEVSP